MEINEQKSNSDQTPLKQSNLSSFMYLFLVGFALITLLAACSMDKDEHIHTVGSETWETTTSTDELPTFLSNHTKLTSELYSHVGEHAHMMGELPCYCGCMEGTEIDEAHDSLLRCYWAEHPADDGAVTWTDHSTTCGICKHEMEMVIEMSNKGSTLDEIKQAIEQAYKQP
ncbi:MAG: PCYCGC domain-containing protein [Candidatus Pristimantibacillus lignocellulolyticus]|uniref:PCYCGC domain-containing protein n=1 Tax=Candidatus Pristimantibacillus lignocellulolyticus TaxID=2994561 RepID=A0A9J6ZF09_9BACL|nr:MAG: PCYCGC domain-containing protein [Candidatus Pristimantibacillus lignocellulolyticus]